MGAGDKAQPLPRLIRAARSIPYVHTPGSEQTKQCLGRGDHRRMLPKVKQICPAPACCQQPRHMEDAGKISATLAVSKQSWRDRVLGLVCFCFLIGVLYILVLHRKIFCLLGGILCLTVLPTPAKICVLLLCIWMLGRRTFHTCHLTAYPTPSSV